MFPPTASIENITLKVLRHEPCIDKQFPDVTSLQIVGCESTSLVLPLRCGPIKQTAPAPRDARPRDPPPSDIAAHVVDGNVADADVGAPRDRRRENRAALAAVILDEIHDESDLEDFIVCVDHEDHEVAPDGAGADGDDTAAVDMANIAQPTAASGSSGDVFDLVEVAMGELDFDEGHLKHVMFPSCDSCAIVSVYWFEYSTNGLLVRRSCGRKRCFTCSLGGFGTHESQCMGTPSHILSQAACAICFYICSSGTVRLGT